MELTKHEIIFRSIIFFLTSKTVNKAVEIYLYRIIQRTFEERAFFECSRMHYKRKGP